MKRITAYGPPLKAGLKDFIASKRQADSVPWGDDFLERLEPFAVSGKLLRGSVLCFVYEAFSGQTPGRDVMDAAMALELTHSALLIHDDIMDRDPMRRGRPAMHEQYRAGAEREGLAESERFGMNMALSGGDAALFLAVELMGRATAGRTGADLFYKLYVDQLLKTCAGQMQDVYFDTRADLPAKRDILALMRTKTASYTLSLPLAMGASMAGAPAAAIDQLREIGVAGGTIFQIRDDELGIFGDPGKTGKPVGSDIKEGKKTLLYHYLMKNCTPAERRELKTVYGNPDASDDDIARIRAFAREHGVQEVLAADIGGLREQALTDIGKLPLADKDKKTLVDLIVFCARRRY